MNSGFRYKTGSSFATGADLILRSHIEGVYHPNGARVYPVPISPIHSVAVTTAMAFVHCPHHPRGDSHAHPIPGRPQSQQGSGPKGQEPDRWDLLEGGEGHQVYEFEKLAHESRPNTDTSWPLIKLTLTPSTL